MAGAKKKKKPAANPARGFATTSIASKPRPETSDEAKASPSTSTTLPPNTKKDATPPSTKPDEQQPGKGTAGTGTEHLSPEEFERQLEESELQLLVERHGQKTKRDAHRQRTRLETDRRLLRGQSDSVNSIKWLPQDLMDQIVNLIKAESRFAVSSLSSEGTSHGKMPSEEDMIARLWTLKQVLTAVDFPEQRIDSVIKHILDISPTISSAAKDMVWGLEEALEWLARECEADELPVYEPKAKPTPRGI